MKKILIGLSVLGLAGCVNLNSLFTGETTADSTLKHDVAKDLQLMSQAQDGCNIESIETRISDIKQKEGQVIGSEEIWVTTNCKRTTDMKIKFNVDPNGGTFYTITTDRK